MAALDVSPFTFIAWKEDEDSIVVGTEDTKLGYMTLLSIDGVDAEAIVAKAKAEQGEDKWEKTLAKEFPRYVQALADAGTAFPATRKAKVEYADMNTGEVLDIELPATSAAYNECVRVETVRGAHTPNIGQEAASDEDEYEDLDDDEDEEDEEDEEVESPEKRRYARRRMFIDMLTTQLETALSIGGDLGLTVEEMREVYHAAAGPHPVPQTPEECFKMAQGDLALQKYLASAEHDGPGGAEGGPQCPQQ